VLIKYVWLTSLICQLKVSTYPLSESKVCSNEGKWNRYSKPECKKSNKGSKRNSCRAALAPQNQVHHKEQAEHNAATSKFLTLGQVQLNINILLHSCTASIISLSNYIHEQWTTKECQKKKKKKLSCLPILSFFVLSCSNVLLQIKFGEYLLPIISQYCFFSYII